MHIDTHCHYNLDPLYSGDPSHFHLKKHSPLLTMNWQEHWQKAQQHGVTRAIVVGTTYETSKRALEIAEQEPNLWATLGIHPNEATMTNKLKKAHASGDDANQILENQTSYLIKEFTHLATLHKHQVVAIGETGLDYFYLPENPELVEVVKLAQLRYLSVQLQLAKQLKLVPILHVRDKDLSENPDSQSAYWKIIEVLKSEWPADKPFILHCISGPQNYVAQAIELGGYIGVAGNVTYKNAADLRLVVKATPQDRILLETDAPYLPPLEHRGKICEPWMVSQTALFLQNELSLSPKQLQKNTQTIFPQLFD
jgi:TatD DNase family protein